MSGLGEWIVTYLRHLHPNIRTYTGDRRLQDAARTAMDNGWTPKQMAAAVTSRDYNGANNPTVLAIVRLEQLCEHPPGTPREPQRGPHPNGCAVCKEGDVCTDPAVSIPVEWTRERLALISQLSLIHPDDLGEEAREQQMIALIRRQQETGHGRLPRT